MTRVFDNDSHSQLPDLFLIGDQHRTFVRPATLECHGAVAILPRVVGRQHNRSGLFQYLRAYSRFHVLRSARARSAAALPVRSTVLLRCVGEVSSWEPEVASGGVCRQIERLQISAVKISRSIAGENSSAQSQSTPIRSGRLSRFGNSPSAPTALTLTASARFTIGSTADRKRRCPSRCASSVRSIQNKVSDGSFTGSLPSGEIEPSVTLASLPSGFTSSDGLGNHQPGSMTWGDRFAMTAPSGRARNRAICPAVARFNEGRAV